MKIKPEELKKLSEAAKKGAEAGEKLRRIIEDFFYNYGKFLIEKIKSEPDILIKRNTGETDEDYIKRIVSHINLMEGRGDDSTHNKRNKRI